MKDDIAYIEHILLSISKIDAFTVSMTRSDFEQNEMVQDAVIRNIEIIGEVSKRVSNDLKTTYFDVPWREMAGMRDKLIHDYMGVDVDVVWKTIKVDIPQLLVLLKRIDL
ncbi:MAG: DUF86 domain-containing protein [Bacteroidetes bacterium]|nr:DUF86 domain-containing protein [Bacteroidota bacterium]